MTTTNNINFENLAPKIKQFLYDYVKVESFTASKCEKGVETFFTDYFSNVEYFKNNPDNFGLYSIENDPHDRHVCWAMVNGSGDDAVVLVHHYDVVGIEDFKNLKGLAFSPDELREALCSSIDMFDEDVQKDLRENTFTFGRGSADMKGGGSIQYMLLEEYSKMEDFKGTVIVIGVPDEENLSAGMRAAVKLLAELKKKYNFNYRIMMNSEPHQRKDFSKGVFSEGTIGKLLPFVYVRGFLAHVGKVFEGLNPVNVMSEIVRRTELNMDLTDTVYPENAPGPTWLYLKDSKEVYDVSMPLNMYGCLSVLTLKKTPAEIMEQVRAICEASFDKVIEEMNASYKTFLVNTGRPEAQLPWKTSVVSFKELYNQAVSDSGEEFVTKYNDRLNELNKEILDEKTTYIDANFRLVDFIFDHVKDMSPKVVYGLVPPYYPSVANPAFDNLADDIKTLSNMLGEYSKENFDLPYVTEYYYTGITDLSYTSIKDPDLVKASMEECMPLFGNAYDLPIDELNYISMPCINIGPWGKDFHKITERVNTEDLLVRTPQILNKAIYTVLNR